MKSSIFILVLIVILGIAIFVVFPNLLSKQNFSYKEKSPSSEGFKPEGFKGPTGPPSVIGPPGPPPNY